MVVRLPNPGSDDGTWGTILNTFLLQAHDTNGTLKGASVGTAQLDSSVQSAFDGKVNTTSGGGEVFFNNGNSGAAITIAAANGNVQQLTLTDTCVITLANPPSGVMCSLTLLITQDGTGSRMITWPTSVSWGEYGAPVLSTGANLTDIVNIFTVDGGTKWFGVAGPRGF